MECMSREDMRRLQSERLIETVKRCYENVPFYKKKMDQKGIRPEDIKSIDDITKLPFTTKHDLRDEYPFGLQAVPMEQVVRVHASSGTTGKPVVATYTQNDLDNWAEGVARVLAVGDVGPGDVVQVSYGYGLFTGGLGAHQGANKLGAIQLPTSAGNSEKQVMLMKDFGTTALCCTPSYALHLTEVMKKCDIKKEDLKLRGPGDLEGTAQSGLPFNLRLPNITKDVTIMEQARHSAQQIIEADPSETHPDYQHCYRHLKSLKKQFTNYSEIS